MVIAWQRGVEIAARAGLCGWPVAAFYCIGPVDKAAWAKVEDCQAGETPMQKRKLIAKRTWALGSQPC